MLAPANGVTWREFFFALKERFIKDKLMDVAGSVTFFGVLALFPFLLFLVTLAGLVLDEDVWSRFSQRLSYRSGDLSPDALATLAESDYIVLAPGNLFTSTVPNLLVRGIPESLQRSIEALVPLPALA